MNIHGGLTQAGSRLLHELKRFWSWWRGCLLASLPPRWRERWGGGADRLLLSQRGDELLVRSEAVAGEHELARIPLLGELPDLDRLLEPRTARLPRWWVLPAQAGIVRRLWLPASASRHLRQVVGFEIDRQTPFSADSVRYDVRTVRTHGDGQIEVELAVVPLRVVERVLQDRTRVAASLAGVDMAGTDGKPSGFNLLPPADRRRRIDPARRWELLLAAIALLAVVAAAAQILGNRRAAADALEARLRTAAPKARLVADQRSRLAGLVEGAVFLDRKRAGQPTATEVWNDVTVRLPDGTWLEKLSIEGDRLHLMGFSDDASSLVRRLEGSALWRKPTLTGALQSDATSGRNRFTLTAQLMGDAPAEGEVAHGDNGTH